MTQAMAGAAKSVLATRKDVRKQKLDVDEVWEQMTRWERFQVLDALGDQVLPVLVALPDVEVEPGTRPTFTDEQVRETVEAGVGDDVGRIRVARILVSRHPAFGQGAPDLIATQRQQRTDQPHRGAPGNRTLGTDARHPAQTRAPSQS